MTDTINFLKGLKIISVHAPVAREDWVAQVLGLHTTIDSYPTLTDRNLLRRAAEGKIDVMIINTPGNMLLQYHEGYYHFTQLMEIRKPGLCLGVNYKDLYKDYFADLGIKFIDANRSSEIIPRLVVAHIIQSGLLKDENLAAAEGYVNTHASSVEIALKRDRPNAQHKIEI